MTRIDWTTEAGTRVILLGALLVVGGLAFDAGVAFGRWSRR